jgi:Glycine/sarcosine/betaine reductase component B subunits
MIAAGNGFGGRVRGRNAVMKLRLESYRVTALAFGSQTAFKDGTLTVDPEEIRRLAGDDTCIADVQVELVAPGEETRIIHVLDALEPRLKG